MNMMNANLGIENLKEKNFTEKQIKDFDPDKAFQSDTVSAQVNVKSDYGKNK